MVVAVTMQLHQALQEEAFARALLQMPPRVFQRNALAVPMKRPSL
jgi:hypothetical protein